MSTLVRIGLCELALGALLGWLVALQVDRPRLVERLGVRSPRRLLSAHLDYVVMGLILIAVGLAVPGLAGWAQVVLVAGTIVNPTLFLPLAFREEVARTFAYRTLSVLSFAATSTGLAAAALS